MPHLQLPLQREKVRKEISSKTITNVVHFFRLIKLSSPNLNYLIGAGAIILYVDIYLLVVPTTDQPTVQVLCSVTPWLTAIGYSLCYGTIVAKMVRVYLIFNNPKPNSRNVRMSFQTPFALRHPFPPLLPPSHRTLADHEGLEAGHRSAGAGTGGPGHPGGVYCHRDITRRGSQDNIEQGKPVSL